jgi:hypothetical protein
VEKIKKKNVDDRVRSIAPSPPLLLDNARRRSSLFQTPPRERKKSIFLGGSERIFRRRR